MARHNRPSLMVYGGSIKGGHSDRLGPVNISTCFEAHGAFSYGKMSENDLEDVVRNACPGPGGCGGMYTANTMATGIEAMGLTLPGSSTTAAESAAKLRECERAAKAIKTCMERNIRPRDLITRESLENALVSTMVMCGSTNSVLHYLAIAHSADIDLTLDDVQRVSNRVPVLADLKPSGRYMVADLAEIGGFPSVLKFLIHVGLINGDIPTVTGMTLRENVQGAPSLDPKQDMIRPLGDPIKESGHIRVLRGNLAPGGAVAKITGKEGRSFTGKAMVFDKEEELTSKLQDGKIDPDENTVLCVRYEGPKGGPGMVSYFSLTSFLLFFPSFLFLFSFFLLFLIPWLRRHFSNEMAGDCECEAVRKRTTIQKIISVYWVLARELRGLSWNIWDSVPAMTSSHTSFLCTARIHLACGPLHHRGVLSYSFKDTGCVTVHARLYR